MTSGRLPGKFWQFGNYYERKVHFIMQFKQFRIIYYCYAIGAADCITDIAKGAGYLYTPVEGKTIVCR